MSQGNDNGETTRYDISNGSLKILVFYIIGVLWKIIFIFVRTCPNSSDVPGKTGKVVVGAVGETPKTLAWKSSA